MAETSWQKPVVESGVSDSTTRCESTGHQAIIDEANETAVMDRAVMDRAVMDRVVMEEGGHEGRSSRHPKVVIIKGIP